jgi:SAM-dependent methyltransferase
MDGMTAGRRHRGSPRASRRPTRARPPLSGGPSSRLARTGRAAYVLLVATRVDYEHHGRGYTQHRQPDPRIAERIHAALADACSVINVGAGAGSYEPDDRWVLAVEPSATMRAQRPPRAAPVISARAEALPFDDNAVDAALACVTIHHWEPPEAGLLEMRRVARSRVVVFSFDLAALPAWQQMYLADGLELERSRFPSVQRIADALGGEIRVEEIPTPADCVDGFLEAFWNRPEALLVSMDARRLALACCRFAG